MATADQLQEAADAHNGLDTDKVATGRRAFEDLTDLENDEFIVSRMPTLHSVFKFHPFPSSSRHALHD